MIIEEVEEFTTTVPVIDDGTLITNAELVKTASSLANRTQYLRARTDPTYDLLTGAKSSVPMSLASTTADLADVALPNESSPFNALNPTGVMGRGLGRWIKAAHDSILGLKAGNTTTWFPPMQCYAPALTTNWDSVDVAGFGWSLAQINNGTAPLFLAIQLPGIAGFIKEIGLYVTGGAGHAALPATKPRLRLIRASVNAGVITHNEVAAVNDPSVDVAAYQVTHTIVLSGLSSAVTPPAQSLWTYLRVTGESGANSIAGEFKIGGLYVITNPNS